MNPILVTGAQGFLGRFFTAAALQSGESVAGVGRSQRSEASFTHSIQLRDRRVPAPLPAAVREALDTDAYRYYRADLLDVSAMRAVIREVQPKAVVHLASALRDDEPGKLVETNILGTIRLLEALSAPPTPIECVVLGSSSAVYGAADTLPIPEHASCKPIDLYGITKYAAEQIGALRLPIAARVVLARIFNLVGPGQDERHVCGRFAAQAVNVSGVHRSFHTGDLRPKRDFIDVRDAANGILSLVRAPLAAGPYNVCSGVETPIQEVLQHALRAAGISQSVDIEQTYTHGADASRNVGDHRRLRALGWSANFTIGDSIGDLVAYYRSLMQTF